MINEKRMEAFEKVYADLHDVTQDHVKLYRFESKDSYSLPGLAHDYRMYCAALDSVVIEFPALCASDDPFELKRDIIEEIEASGVRVKS